MPYLLADSTPDIGALNDLFQPLYTQLQDTCFDINATLMDITYVLGFIGLLLIAYRVMMGGDLSGIGTQLFITACVAVLLPGFPDFIMQCQKQLGTDLLDQLNMDITTYLGTFCSKVAGGGIISDGLDTLPLIINPLSLILAFVNMIISIIIMIMAFVAWLMTLLAFVGQTVALYVGCGIVPIFAGMLMFDITRETGTKYIMGLMGVLFWPLGWGIGFKLIQSCDDVWDTFLRDCAPLMVVDEFLGGLVSSMVYIIEVLIMYKVILKAPKLMQAAIVSGSQVATGLVSAAMGTAVGTAAGAAGMAAGAAGSAMGMMPGPAGAVGSSAAGAVGSGVSSLGSSAGAAAGAIDT